MKSDTAVGFTGTSRSIPALPQALALKHILRGLWSRGYSQLEHGEAENADELANNIAHSIGFLTAGHPSSKHSHRTTVDVQFPPAHPLTRNQTIVSRVSRLIAMPDRPESSGRAGGGTWATVRYARKAGLPIAIIWPDGEITREGPAWLA